MEQFFIAWFVRLVAHRKVDPCFLIHDTLVMGKGSKAFFAVICTHAAFAKAAKSHLRSGKMDQCIIDTAAAKTAFFHEFPRSLTP